MRKYVVLEGLFVSPFNFSFPSDNGEEKTAISDIVVIIYQRLSLCSSLCRLLVAYVMVMEEKAQTDAIIISFFFFSLQRQ